MPGGKTECDGDSANLILVCKQMENLVITIGSTFNTNQALSTEKRYPKKQKKKQLEIDCPDTIKQYNKHMGETTIKIKI